MIAETSMHPFWNAGPFNVSQQIIGIGLPGDATGAYYKKLRG